MRVTITEKGWALEEIGELEWLFLERLPGTACGEELPPEQKRRLMPDPIAGKDASLVEHEEFNSDWDEYVRPELNVAFTEARQQVMDDLNAVSEEEAVADVESDADPFDGGDPDLPEDEESGTVRRLEVAGEHSENWYSTLNQARLLMNEVYDLAASEQRLYATMVATEEGDEDEDKEGDEQPDDALSDGMLWMMLAQYQFYSFIQSFLIERVIKL